MAIHIARRGRYAGKPVKCPAKIQCTLTEADGSPARHFETKEEAEQFLADQAEKEHGLLPKTQKKSQANEDQAREGSTDNLSNIVDEEEGLAARTYTIFGDRLGEVKKTIDRANARLEKAGIEDRFEYTVREYTVRKTGPDGRTTETSKAEVVLNHPRISYNGYEFIARVEEVSPGNFIAYGPNGKSLDGWRPSSMDCEHCGKTRHRNKVYAVKDESGGVKVVGGSCVQLYTGMEPAGLLSLEYSLSDYEESDSVGFSRGKPVEKRDDIIAISYVLTKEGGYQNARSDNPTSEQVHRVLHPSRHPADREFADRIRAEASHVDAEAIRKEALEAIGDNDSDWATNVRALLHDDTQWVGSRSVATTASALAAVHKSHAQKRQRQSWTPGFVAAEKEKVADHRVKVVKVQDFEEDYGYGPPKTVSRVTMQDEKGHRIQWKAYGDGVPRAGDELLMNATVKKNETWKGMDSTIMTRAKFKNLDGTRMLSIWERRDE